jgi:hypothetical protein
MQATVITVRSHAATMQSVEALTANELLFVFSAPTGRFNLGDSLELDIGLIDMPQAPKSSSTGASVEVVIKSNDVHDLRQPSGHGSSRFPSKERLSGA